MGIFKRELVNLRVKDNDMTTRTLLPGDRYILTLRSDMDAPGARLRADITAEFTWTGRVLVRTKP